MSGWPSGLRRQTQGYTLLPSRRLNRDYWSSYEGRGSNPLPDKSFYLFYKIVGSNSGNAGNSDKIRNKRDASSRG
jgi:hypothetical protein